MAARDDKSPVRRILDLKLNSLSSMSSSSQASIFRAPRELRQLNERAFEPQIISIGPYHHQGKDHLKAMEIHKVRYLSNLQRRYDQNFDLDSCIAFSVSNEGKARDCYPETVNMRSEEFVAMMVLDGLFVVELIRKFTYHELREENDDLFKHNLNLATVAQDLLLLENQLPFFVLQNFADMSMNVVEKKSFVQEAVDFFSEVVPGKVLPYGADPLDNQHLLGLVHGIWLEESYSYTLFSRLSSCLKRRERRLLAGKWDFIRSATELSELGIKFKKDSKKSLFDIKFAKGQMHIPILIVNHNTERLFRNLIAYEQFNHGYFCIVMDYARLMDCLIDYADDVALLCGSGIIENRLGTNEEVATMFNKLNDYVFLSPANFYYSHIFRSVNEHCRQPCNLWKMNLRQTYFHTPWDWVLTSIVAATILLLLSLIQTIFSVLAYFK